MGFVQDMCCTSSGDLPPYGVDEGLCSAKIIRPAVGIGRADTHEDPTAIFDMYYYFEYPFPQLVEVEPPLEVLCPLGVASEISGAGDLDGLYEASRFDSEIVTGLLVSFPYYYSNWEHGDPLPKTIDVRIRISPQAPVAMIRHNGCGFAIYRDGSVPADPPAPYLQCVDSNEALNAAFAQSGVDYEPEMCSTVSVAAGGFAAGNPYCNNVLFAKMCEQSCSRAPSTCGLDDEEAAAEYRVTLGLLPGGCEGLTCDLISAAVC